MLLWVPETPVLEAGELDSLPPVAGEEVPEGSSWEGVSPCRVRV